MEIDREGHRRPLRDARRRDPQRRADDLHATSTRSSPTAIADVIAQYATLVPHVRADARAVRDPERAPAPPRLDRLRPEGAGDRARRRGHGRGDHRARAQRRAPAHRRVHAGGERDRRRSTSTSTTCRRSIASTRSRIRSRSRSSRSSSARSATASAATPDSVTPAALPEARRADARHARGEADRLPDAADDAEGALRPDEPRPLRAGRRRATRTSRRRSAAIPTWSSIARCASRGTAA